MGGEIEDSAHIHGVIMTKNVAHKKMSHFIENPKILLLEFALEFERDSSALSIGPVYFTFLFFFFFFLFFFFFFFFLEKSYLMNNPKVLLQEKDYLKKLIGHISALKPDIVVVEKTVSQVAQELLLRQGITLIKMTKSSKLRSLSRSTGAQILTSTGIYFIILFTYRFYFIYYFIFQIRTTQRISSLGKL